MFCSRVPPVVLGCAPGILRYSNHYPFHYGTPITTTNKLSRFHKANKRNGLTLVSRLAAESAARDCDISGTAALRRHCLDLLGGLAGECGGWL